jgi:hypothetical protein
MPTGALVVNPKGPRTPKLRKPIDVKSIFASFGGGSAKTNPHRRRRKNPIVLTNGKRRKHSRVRVNARRKNPIVLTNGKHRRKHISLKGRKTMRRNPGGYSLMYNPARSLTDMLKPVTNAISKIPLAGPTASMAVGLAAGAAGAGLGAAAMHFVMPYVEEVVPDMIKPVGYTIAGSLGAALLAKLAPASLPFKSALVMGLPAAGVAIDVYRYWHGASDSLSGDMDGLGAPSYIGDIGDVDDLGTAFAAYEYANASLNDADYCGEDLSGEELGQAEFGRSLWWRRFRPEAKVRPDPSRGGASEHAGQPGNRWGWLIYAIGYENFQKLRHMPEPQRKKFIQDFRFQAKQLAQKMVQQGIAEPTVEEAQVNGLLVAGS